MANELKKIVMEKLERWIIFSVFFALLPFLGNLLIEVSKGHEITLAVIFGSKGELLLVGIALCGVGLGELLGSAASPVSTHPLLTYVYSGLSLATICLGSLYYANVAGGTEFNPDMVVFISLWGFVLSVFASTGCIVIAAYAEGKHLQQLTMEKLFENKQPVENEQPQV